MNKNGTMEQTACARATAVKGHNGAREQLKRTGKIFLIIPFICSIVCFSCSSPENVSLKLCYSKPAAIWEEALPVGNGRLGAMVFGDPVHEHLQINEESIWAGSKIDNNNPGALGNLHELQQYLFESRYKEAYRLAERDMLGTPPRIRSYQPFGDININYKWDAEPSDYSRNLNLETGIATTAFSVNGKRFSQELIASSPGDIIVVHIKSIDGGPLNVSFGMTREKDARIIVDSGNVIRLEGQIVDDDDILEGPGGKHMKFAGELRLSAGEGTVAGANGLLTVSNAKEITVRFTAATDYNVDKLDFDRSINPVNVCKTILDRTDNLSWDDLRKQHLDEYNKLFSRVTLSLGVDSLSYKPTDERLAAVKKGAVDKGLEVLYFQYGRYLLMSSSRPPGRLPANLQGIWNKDMEAPWNSDFHTNINLQMNYWPAEVCNMPETSEILTAFLEKLSGPGSVTAKEMYGAGGWTIHHLTDPFGRSGVADGVWGITPMDGPWMTSPVYEHYLFTQDTLYLKNEAYPLMKGAARFVLGFLVESPEGYLVTNPSHSPENSFRDTVTGDVSALTYAATTDIEIINELFDNCIEAAGILNIDKDFSEELKEVQKRLPPVRINSKGVIMEWIKDYEETEPGHRHMSHLLGLYPFAQFTPETPELFEAANNTITRRLSFGGGHTGWSRAWIINLFARLQNGEKAYENLLELLKQSTLDNLFDTHPPYQIDGNFGGTAGIAEMLLQSHNDIIRLLPAIPEEWDNGEVKGLCARGGFVVGMKWSGGRLNEAKISSVNGGNCRVVYNDDEHSLNLKPGETFTIKY